MQVKSMLRVAFVLGLCGILFGITGANAASKPAHPTRAHVGSLSDLRMSPVGSAYCESGCCWASGEHVVCSESGCYAEGGGESAEYICKAQ